MLLPSDTPQEAPHIPDIKPCQLISVDPTLLGQPSQNEMMQMNATSNNNATGHDATQLKTLHEIPLSLGNVIWKVKENLHDLILSLFIDICRAVETSQAIPKANAQLEAMLFKKRLLT
jgi:hypothetical protein